MLVSIESQELWEKTADISNDGNAVGLEHIASYSNVSKLGLQYINSATLLINNKFVTKFVFKVIDDKKWVIAKIKYGFRD